MYPHGYISASANDSLSKDHNIRTGIEPVSSDLCWYGKRLTNNVSDKREYRSTGKKIIKTNIFAQIKIVENS